jgi:hypothetical protein
MNSHTKESQITTESGDLIELSFQTKVIRRGLGPTQSKAWIAG